MNLVPSGLQNFPNPFPGNPHWQEVLYADWAHLEVFLPPKLFTYKIPMEEECFKEWSYQELVPAINFLEKP